MRKRGLPPQQRSPSNSSQEQRMSPNQLWQDEARSLPQQEYVLPNLYPPNFYQEPYFYQSQQQDFNPLQQQAFYPPQQQDYYQPQQQQIGQNYEQFLHLVPPQHNPYMPVPEGHSYRYSYQREHQGGLYLPKILDSNQIQEEQLTNWHQQYDEGELQPYGVLSSDQQSMQEKSDQWNQRYQRSTRQQSTLSQSRHQASQSFPRQEQQVQNLFHKSQETFRDQQLQLQISEHQDLSECQIPPDSFPQPSTSRQQVPPISQQQRGWNEPQKQVSRSSSHQQQQYNFSGQQQGRGRGRGQQRMRDDQQTKWNPSQEIHNNQSQFRAEMIDDANYKVTEAAAQNNDRDIENYKQQQQQATTNILSSLSQLTLKQTSQETEMSEKISLKMKEYQACIPKRQNLYKAGTLGTPINIETNMFKIIFKKNFVTEVIHYDVDIAVSIDSKKIPKALYRKVFEKCRSEHFPNRYPAFDGKKNAYSANKLFDNDIFQTDIKIQECGNLIFKITLKIAAFVDLNWIKNLRPGLDEADRNQTGIQVLDIILRHNPESLYVNIARGLFWNLNERNTLTRLTDGLSLAYGGFLSAVLGWQMYLNVDVVHKGFLTSQKVTDLIDEFLERKKNKFKQEHPRLDVYDRKAIDKILKGARVTYIVPQPNPRKKKSSNDESSSRPPTYRLSKLGPNANTHWFRFKGSDITITNYFAQHYGYKLRHPAFTCASKVKGKDDKEQMIYLPAELCTIVAGQSIKILNEKQTASMIKETAKGPSDRNMRIMESFAKINVNDTTKQEFELSVNDKMTNVNARILDAPELKYAQNIITVTKGKWQMHEFKQPITLKGYEWTIFDFNNENAINSSQLNQFMDELIQNAKELGMQIEQAYSKNFKRLEKAEDIKNHFNKALKLIIVIIPPPDRDNKISSTIYNEIKQIAELELGVLTQCVKFKSISKMFDIGKKGIDIHKQQLQLTTTIKNILLKINTKLNGVSHTLYTTPKCLKKFCMLVGADVTHPSDEKSPSVAAVTASNDIFGFQYNVMYKLLSPKEEIILDFEEIIKHQLLIYREKTSHLPESIIYYRDGVSEGQFSQVMYYEIQAIRRACAAHKANIQITCLIVQKRHHVRFFVKSSQNSKQYRKAQNSKQSAKPEKQYENVEAGTIVDTEITHPNHIDFYLVSHASIMGTAKPTKYRCICNESNYTEDEIEELTYYLCHMYARCTRAVSYPAPTYYAHLAAYRGNILIQGSRHLDNLNNLERVQKELTQHTHKMINTPMYFV